MWMESNAQGLFQLRRKEAGQKSPAEKCPGRKSKRRKSKALTNASTHYLPSKQSMGTAPFQRQGWKEIRNTFHWAYGAIIFGAPTDSFKAMKSARKK